MLIPKRKQPGFFCLLLSPLHILLMVTFPKLRKIPARRKDASRNSGKSQRDGKVLPETSENPNVAEKCFPKLRKVPMRRKSASRNFGKSQCGGKVLPETSESPNAAEKYFPKLRKVPMRRKSASRNFGKSQCGGKAFICIKNGLPANLYSKDSFLPGGHLHSQDLSSMSAESDGQRPDLSQRHINSRHRRRPAIYNPKLRLGYD